MNMLNIFSTKQSDANQVVIRPITPNTKPVSRIPEVKTKTLSYAQQFSSGRGHFLTSEYDLSEIGKITDTDSFVRQAFKKKEGLMFKEGLGFKGANKRTVQYVKTRMAQIAKATNIPTIELIKRTARCLISTSNAFIVKVRDEKASGGRSRIDARGRTFKPVAGYFPAAPESMRVDLDPNTGQILKWRQLLPDGRYRDFRKEDVIHFHIDRREGFLFGVPVLVPVKDDIRALRQIEENIELLLYQNLFPLFHYKVGTETAPAGYTEDGIKEIDIVEQQVRVMPAEGAIVTPERHEIKAIGSEGRALRAEGYLTHFKRRVLTGLGVSEVDMGEGDTSNRATANVLSRQLVDSVKDIQDTLEAQWDHEVITELLLESTFGDMVLEEENMVHLNFNEIDIQNKMEQEKHKLEMFQGNAITWDELRADLNREPIIVPETGDDQDPAKYPEWFNTYWKLFGEPDNLIRAVDEPFSLAAKAAAEARATGTTNSQIQTATQEAQQREKQGAEEDRKTKVAIAHAKPSPSTTTQKRDNFIAKSFEDLESDSVLKLQAGITQRNIIDKDGLLSLGQTWAADMTRKFHSEIMLEFFRGFNDQSNMKASEAEILIGVARTELRDRVNFYLNRLAQDAMRLVEQRVDSKLGDVKLTGAESNAINELHLAFDTVRYRTEFLWDVERRKAYNYGRVLGMRFLNQYGFTYQAAIGTECERCKLLDGQLVLAENATIDDVPPLHPHSKMQMKIITTTPEMGPHLNSATE